MSTETPLYRLPCGSRDEAAGIALSAVSAVVGTIVLAVCVATQYVVDTDVGRLMVFAQNTQGGAEVIGPGKSVTLTFSPESTFVLEDSP